MLRRIGMRVLATLAMLTIALILARAASASPRPDPGFPYVDANCDRAFDPADGDIGSETGVDVLALVLQGVFDTAAPVGNYVPPPAPACFVWPPSVRLSSRAVAAIEITAEAHLVFLGKVELGAGSVTLAAARHLEADGAAIFAAGDVVLTAGLDEDADGVLSAVDARMRSSAGDVAFSATEALHLSGIDVRARGDVSIAKEGSPVGGIDVEHATLRSTAGTVDVYSGFAYSDVPSASADDVAVRLNGSKIGALSVSVATAGAGIFAEAARIQGSPDDGVTLDSAGGLVAMDRVKISRVGSIDVWTWVEPDHPTGQSHILANGAKLATDGTIDFDSGGCGGSGDAGRSEIIAERMSLRTKDGADLVTTSDTEAGFIDVRDARLFVNDAYPSDLRIAVLDDEPVARDSTIDARGVHLRDPLLPTFFAEHVLGDPTPNTPDLLFAPNGVRVTQLSPSELQVDWTIANQGPPDVAPGIKIRFVRSSDEQLDATDVELGTITVTTVIPGRSGQAAGSAVFDVPADELFYVIALVDPSDVVAELDEQNNVRSVRRPLPDLTFAGPLGIVMPSETEAQVTWALRNGGDLASPAGVAIHFYLSADGELDASDPLLDAVTLPDPLASGGSVTGTEMLTGLPADGLFFVIAVVDPNDDVLEAFESNNQRTAGVGPDVTIAQVIARYSESAQKFVITARVINEGLRPAVGPIETRFWAYPSPVGETPLGGLTFDDLAPGAFHEETIEFPFIDPSTEERPMPPLWFVRAVTDAADAIAEPDEANNGSILVYVNWIP